VDFVHHLLDASIQSLVDHAGYDGANYNANNGGSNLGSLGLKLSRIQCGFDRCEHDFSPFKKFIGFTIGYVIAARLTLVQLQSNG
jgi:hypothetical protein